MGTEPTESENFKNFITYGPYDMEQIELVFFLNGASDDKFIKKVFRNVVNHFTMNAGVNKLQEKYLIELSKTLIFELSPDLSTTTRIKQVETLLTEISMRSKNKMTIFFLISSELTSELDAIDKCIENE